MTIDKKQLLNMLTTEEVESVTKVIVSLSVKFVERFPFLVVDDCIQESWKELIRYQSYYDKNKGTSITTWVYMLVRRELTSYAQKEFNKTQKWDDIEQHVFEDETVVSADKNCAYDDILEVMKTCLSPHAYRLLLYLDKSPAACLAELSQKLNINPRDLLYLRDELKATYQHVTGIDRR